MKYVSLLLKGSRLAAATKYLRHFVGRAISRQAEPDLLRAHARLGGGHLFDGYLYNIFQYNLCKYFLEISLEQGLPTYG